MKTAISLLAVLAVVAAVSLAVNGQTYDRTWVSNESNRPIRASTTYNFAGTSFFTNRLITPGNAAYDDYSNSNCKIASAGQSPQPVNVALWVDGAVRSNTVAVSCDESLVGVTNVDASGVDIYQSAYNQIDQTYGNILATIFPYGSRVGSMYIPPLINV